MTTTENKPAEKETIKRLKADLVKAASTLATDEARYLVDLYYQIQDFRLRAESEKRATSLAKCRVCEHQVVFKKNKKTGELTLAEHTPKQKIEKAKPPRDVEAEAEEAAREEAEAEIGRPEVPPCAGSGVHPEPEDVIREPNELVSWAFEEFETVENLIKKALDVWTDNDVIGQWSKSLVGIGPVIAAGLLAHIDPKLSATVGNLWSFAGLNPNQKWEKGQKRPWNARLRVIAWKASTSFMKQRKREGCIYGQIFETRWALEKERNARGVFADQAKAALEEKTFGKKTEAYKAYAKGKLPLARILLRAQRVASKIFLSHWLVVAKWAKEGVLPPAPYSIEILKHGHVIPVPNTELVPGLVEALRKAGRTA